MEFFTGGLIISFAVGDALDFRDIQVERRQGPIGLLVAKPPANGEKLMGDKGNHYRRGDGEHTTRSAGG